MSWAGVNPALRGLLVTSLGSQFDSLMKSHSTSLCWNETGKLAKANEYVLHSKFCTFAPSERELHLTSLRLSSGLQSAGTSKSLFCNGDAIRISQHYEIWHPSISKERSKQYVQKQPNFWNISKRNHPNQNLKHLLVSPWYWKISSEEAPMFSSFFRIKRHLS